MKTLAFLKNPLRREIFVPDFNFLNLLVYIALQTFMAKFWGMARKIIIDKLRVQEMTRRIKGFKFRDNACLHNSKYFEQWVSIQGSFSYREGKMAKEDRENGFYYEISEPSLEYILALFQNNLKFIREYAPLHILLKRFLEKESMKEIKFEYIVKNFLRIITLKIKSEKALSYKTFHKLFISFLFHLNHNLHLPIVGHRLMDIRRIIRIKRYRRLSLNNIDVPKRRYDPELVYYYQQALSSLYTNSIALEFLSYYHIIEYFYENIFEENLMDNVKSLFTVRGVFHKNRKNLKKLVKLIQKHNEKDMLQLVLKKFLDINRLIQDLNNHDKTYYLYLLRNSVKFAKAPPLNQNKIFETLAARIYTVRNALVHSKEGEKPKYVPFSKYEEDLKNEIPLMRYIAEQIIIKNSEELC